MEKKGAEPWIDYRGLKCVVLCAGEGRRIRPESSEKPKVIIGLRNKPLLGYVVDYWRRYTQDFIFVVGYEKEQVIEFASQLPINSQFVEQKELKGIAQAVMCVRELVSERFIVVLGDCLCHGSFDFTPNMEQGIGVWQTDDIEAIKHSYSLDIKDDFVRHVKEKPEQVSNNLCGMGFYFFHKRLFDYIKLTKPSPLRGEVEITDTIQNMIDGGEKITPVFFRGNYLNVTYPEDVVKAEKLLESA